MPDQQDHDFKRSQFFLFPTAALPLLYAIFASYGLILLYLFGKTLWVFQPTIAAVTSIVGTAFIIFILGYAITGEKFDLQTVNYSPSTYSTLWFWIILFFAPGVVVCLMTLLHGLSGIDLQPYLLYVLDITFPLLSFASSIVGKYSSEAQVYGDQKQFGKLMGKALKYQILALSFALWTITLIKRFAN